MSLTRENARDRISSLHKDPKGIFGNTAENITDMTETDGRLLCVCGLPFYAPICLALENDDVISRYLSKYRVITSSRFQKTLSVIFRAGTKFLSRKKYLKGLSGLPLPLFAQGAR